MSDEQIEKEKMSTSWVIFFTMLGTIGVVLIVAGIFADVMEDEIDPLYNFDGCVIELDWSHYDEKYNPNTPFFLIDLHNCLASGNCHAGNRCHQHLKDMEGSELYEHGNISGKSVEELSDELDGLPMS